VTDVEGALRAAGVWMGDGALKARWAEEGGPPSESEGRGVAPAGVGRRRKGIFCFFEDIRQQEKNFREENKQRVNLEVSSPSTYWRHQCNLIKIRDYHWGPIAVASINRNVLTVDCEDKHRRYFLELWIRLNNKR